MAHPSRASQTREATARPAIGGESRGMLWVDPASLDPAFDYQWVRESTLGEYDERNLQEALSSNGFVPVDVKEMPGAAPPALPGRKVTDGLIRRGGLILMKRSKEIAQEQREAMEAANEAAVRGVTKDLAGQMDGKNFQSLAERPVTVAVERGGPGGAERFAE